jgi:hypothetical protein
MTHVCCFDCRLRFPAAATAYLMVCPQCAAPLEPIAGLEIAVGLRLFRLEDFPNPLPEAAAVSIPFHDPSDGPS